MLCLELSTLVVTDVCQDVPSTVVGLCMFPFRYTISQSISALGVYDLIPKCRADLLVCNLSIMMMGCLSVFFWDQQTESLLPKKSVLAAHVLTHISLIAVKSWNRSCVQHHSIVGFESRRCPFRASTMLGLMVV